MKNICLIYEEQTNYGDVQICKNCNDGSLGFRTTGQANYCPYCGVEFNAFYKRKNKHRYAKSVEFYRQPRFVYKITHTNPIWEEVEVDKAHSKKQCLAIIRELKQDEEEWGQKANIEVTIKLINGKKGELP